MAHGAKGPDGTHCSLDHRTGMTRSSLVVRFPVLAAVAIAIAGCGGREDTAEVVSEEEGTAPRGSYEIDPATGETRASFTDDEGAVTTMRSGERVPVALPAGFKLYPGARITNNTRVDQADGQLVLINLESEATPEEMVAFYRNQAEAAGIDVAMSLESGSMTMIGGESSDGTSFSFTATRENDTTQAQLSIGRGIE